jgi:hypothetical protein
MAGWLVVLRVLPALLAVGLFVYCLVECLQSAPNEVRTLPKPVWLFVIVMPVIGPLLWLLAGRPHRARHSRPPRSPRSGPEPMYDSAPPAPGAGPTYPLGPDDDPEFLEKLRRDQEHRRRHPEHPKEADD